MESDENIGKYFLEYWAENASMRARVLNRNKKKEIPTRKYYKYNDSREL